MSHISHPNFRIYFKSEATEPICPKCNQWVLIHDAQSDKAVCPSCGFSVDADKIDVCRHCGQIIYNCEDAPICEDCVNELVALALEKADD